MTCENVIEKRTVYSLHVWKCDMNKFLTLLHSHMGTYPTIRRKNFNKYRYHIYCTHIILCDSEHTKECITIVSQWCIYLCFIYVDCRYTFLWVKRVEQ